MKTATKLTCCNKCLACVFVMMFVSGIQLEATSGKSVWYVWFHIIIGAVFTVLLLYHIYLHYKFSNWFSRLARHRSIIIRFLWMTFLLNFTIGIAASIHWLDGYAHSPLGGIHGKFGFLMVMFAVIHIVRQIRKRKYHPKRKDLHPHRRNG